MALVAPVTRDSWSYSGDFYVEASGNNRHRRATIPEVRAVFDGSDGSKDRPAHWYEAQLIHYGLPPSKTKGTAKMRLFDAATKGNLAVPAHILKVESELKKEWTKREREAKQALKKLSVPAGPAPAQGSRKRNHMLSNPESGLGPTSLPTSPTLWQGNVQIAPAEPASKKAKTTKAASSAPGSTPSARHIKQTARRGISSVRGAKSVSSHTTFAAPDEKSATYRPIQTARRSRPFVKAGQGRPIVNSGQALQPYATPSHWDSPDDPPPPYPGSFLYREDGYGNGGCEGGDSQCDAPLPPLGLLNGRSRLRCTGPPEFADRGEDSGIIFTLDGDTLWGSFEIGPLSGILRLGERPWLSSYQPLYFQWRGEDNQGMHHVETGDGSYLQFLGDGVIVGKIGFYQSMLEFSGYRINGRETRSELSAFSMRQEWEQRGL